MKTVLCYGDSNVWGNIPGSFNEQSGLSQRYPKNKRWTGILQQELGDNYYVIEEGLNGRTTTLDEIFPGKPYKNGLTHLPVCLETHYPIDLVILWLGTCDVKIQFKRPANEITEGMRQLMRVIKSSNKGPNGLAPDILLISPQPIVKLAKMHPQFDDAAIQKSRELSSLYQALAKEENCAFLDAASFVASSLVDGFHLDEDVCQKLGGAVSKKVKSLLT